MGAFVVPASGTPTVRALGEAATRRGLTVVPLALGQEPDVVPRGRVHLFGGPLLAAQVSRRTPVALLEPHDGWLAELPARFVRRRVRLMSALDAYGLQERCFVKMPRHKGFEPGPYLGHELPTLPEDEPLLVSDVVSMGDEHRFWVLDGAVHAASSYRLHGRPEARPLDPHDPYGSYDPNDSASLLGFVDELLADQAARLPSAVVVDVAWVSAPDPGWAVVEANMAWFSAHYAADPDRVLDVVLRAAGPPEDVTARDAPFAGVRPTR